MGQGDTLEYPDDFNVPTFPAGPRIATSRMFGIGIMVVLFLVVIACGLILWVQRSAHVHPFVVSVNPITGQWEVVGHTHSENGQMTTDQALQESVVGKFVQDWFEISADTTTNDNMWMSCDYATDCSLGKNIDVKMGRCALFCVSGEEVFTHFTDSVIPGYRARVESGETWHFDMSSFQISPVGQFNANGGSWQIRGTIYSNISAPISILGYAMVKREMERYPQTMGYYVSEFSAYKLN